MDVGVGRRKGIMLGAQTRMGCTGPKQPAGFVRAAGWLSGVIELVRRIKFSVHI
jgi:hypothetical protein